MLFRSSFLFSLNKNLKHFYQRMSADAANKQRIFVTLPLPDEALKLLESKNVDLILNREASLRRETLLESVKNCDALLCSLRERIDKQVLDAAGDKLKVDKYLSPKRLFQKVSILCKHFKNKR